MSEVCVALMRGINVGGKNMLPMKVLAAMFEAAGARSVRTYIQSGNVVFEAPAARRAKLALAVRAAVKKQLGFESEVVVRSAEELERVARSNPFLPKAELAQLYVAFLADRPTPAQVKALDPSRSPPDAFRVVGREVYLKLPNGAGRTKLTNAYFDSKLGTVSTMRNWRTVLTLLEMTQG